MVTSSGTVVSVLMQDLSIPASPHCWTIYIHPTKSTRHLNHLQWGAFSVSSDGKRIAWTEIRSSGGYFHCVKYELLRTTTDESTDFWAINLWDFKTLDQKSPQTNLVYIGPVHETRVLDVHSPAHSALQWAGRPQSEHLSGCVHRNLPAQSLNRPLVLLGSTGTKEKRRISIF